MKTNTPRRSHLHRALSEKRLPVRIAWRLWPLLLWLLLTLPAVVQAQFNYTTNNGTITITGYTGPGGAVTIPATINGRPVTDIGVEAFYDHSDVTSVTIPNSVTNIGGHAFYRCTSLSAITVDALNSAYSSVDGVLFNKSQTLLIQCPERKAGSYTIPNSVTSIGRDAFSFCYSQTSVTIPNSVTNIGAGAFWYCTNLTSVTIPNSVTGIAAGTFYYCTSLTSVTIGNGVTYIGVNAFYVCDSLTSLTIPDSVTSIESYAFAGCTSLTNVTIPNSVTSIGSYVFVECTSLTSVTIPNSVTSIGDFAFFYCTSLTNATIGNGVTTIGNWAFYYCTNLTSVTIPNGVTYIGSYAFQGCTSLTGVYFQGNAPGDSGNVFNGANNVTVYYLPGTTGWGATFAGRPTALWSLPYPLILNFGPSFGVQTNAFGFIISWATNVPVVVEAATELAHPAWVSVGTNTLTSGSSYFSDPEWTNHPARFYRLRSP